MNPQSPCNKILLWCEVLLLSDICLMVSQEWPRTTVQKRSILLKGHIFGLKEQKISPTTRILSFFTLLMWRSQHWQSTGFIRGFTMSPAVVCVHYLLLIKTSIWIYCAGLSCLFNRCVIKILSFASSLFHVKINAGLLLWNRWLYFSSPCKSHPTQWPFGYYCRSI